MVYELWGCIEVKFKGRADPDWVNTSVEPYQHTSRKKESTDTGTQRRENSGGATGDRTQVSGIAHQRSNH